MPIKNPRYIEERVERLEHIVGELFRLIMMGWTRERDRLSFEKEDVEETVKEAKRRTSKRRRPIKRLRKQKR